MNYCLMSCALAAHRVDFLQKCDALAQTILQAFNSSYAERSKAAPLNRGILNSTTWGRLGGGQYSEIIEFYFFGKD